MKVVFISTMLPSGHYSQFITKALSRQKGIELFVYTDKNKENLKIKGCGRIMNIWSKSPKYILEILTQLKKDKPDVVHLQQELNMYGGIITAILFPLLVALIKFAGFRTVVTIHASVYKKQITKDFMRLFHQDSWLMLPIFLKLVFHYIFFTTSIFSDGIIVHTKLAKDILVSDYGVSEKKTIVIPIAIPQRYNYKVKKEKYFFYFGYMVRRKGLGFALDGFKKYIQKNPKSPFKLILAGGVIRGQEKAFDEIKQFVSKLDLGNRVVIKGYIDQKEQDDLYQKAFAVIIPAVITMGSSGPLFHANSFGKCVIATKEGHFTEDITNRVTGILTTNDNWDKAYSHITANSKLVANIEKNVIRKALDRSPDVTAEKYYKEVYNSVNDI